MKHIYLDKLFLFFLLIIIITGNFYYFLGYFSLLLIHEIGHAITGIMLGYKLERIIFYPLGGITILTLPINISLKKELLIIIMGPIFQIIGYIFLKEIFPFIKIYHYTLLMFNLLPLYPLDGGRIINLLFNYQFNCLLSLKITYIISFIMIILLLIYNYYCFNLNLLLMIIMLFIKLVKIYRNKFYYYQRLLLERILYQYNFTKIKNINNIKCFYRDRYHYINYISENEYLKNYFKNK